jgi:hypothetical protein
MFLDEKTIPVPVKTLQPWQELLLKAADFMDNLGMCRGTFEGYDGHVCLRGAIYLAYKGAAYPGHWYELYQEKPSLEPVLHQAEQAVLRTLKVHSIIQAALWNNDIAKDKAEVVGMLRRAAA